MEINKIKMAAEIAKSRTNDKRWTAAIDKAVAGVESGAWIVTELAHGIMVTTENGTYHANGACQCRAYELGQACKHRALARLVEIANEIKETAPAAVSPRADVIAEITDIWPATWPPLYAESLARFGKSDLNMLDDDSLRRVRLAVAL
jgi:hypothetical protein